MTPQRAKLHHTPRLLGILWAFTRATPWLPVLRSRWIDANLMGRIIRRGWVRHVGDAKGPAGFIARDGEVIHALYGAQGFDELLCSHGLGNDENLPDILMVWQAGDQTQERCAA